MFVFLSFCWSDPKIIISFPRCHYGSGKAWPGDIFWFSNGLRSGEKERVMMVVVQWKRASLKTQVHVSVSAGFYIIPRSDQILGAVSEF